MVLDGVLIVHNDEGEDVARLGEGDFFGARALIGGGREVSVSAKEDATIATLSLEELESLLSAEDGLGAMVERVFATPDEGMLQYGVVKACDR